MSLKIIKQFIESWYTPKDQEGSDSPARFKLKPLNGLEVAEIISEVDGEKGTLSFKGLKLAVTKGVVNWENVEGLEFSILNIKYLPGALIHELAAEIISKSTISELEVKK